MWIYTRNDDATARQELNHDDGFWLDYWLFLHADETDRVWSCRPLGVAGLGGLASTIRLPVDRRLVVAVNSEIQSYERLGMYMPTPVPALAPQTGQWSPELREWLEQIQDPEFGRTLRRNLATATLDALTKSDLFTVGFLCRRLASELSDVYSSDRAVLQVTQGKLLREGGAGSFRDRLFALLTDRPEDAPFSVEARLAPVAISNPVAKWKFGPDISLVTEAAPDHTRRPFLLTGVRVDVDAPSAEWAASAALHRIRHLLDTLRVRHYVRTNLYGALAVARRGEEVAYVPLAQPFWDKKPGRRAVPYLARPSGTDVRIHAASWHLSEAINAWAEDVHLAASEVWQAMEAYGGTSSDLSSAYLDAHPSATISYWAQCVSQQASRYSSILGGCDWYYFNRTRLDVMKWLGRVTHPLSVNRYSTWVKPPCPALFFDPRVGLLTLLGRHALGIRRLGFLRQRLSNDLIHLYGIRNRAVHQGERTAPDRWVAFLARLGLEVLLLPLKGHQQQEATTD